MNFLEISGTVIDSETWSETHVTGSSNGMAIRGMGVSSGRVSSTVKTVAQLWLQTDDGREIAVRINPDKFAVRGGHRVSLLTVPKKAGAAWVAAGFNHATGEKHRESGTSVIVLGVMSLLLFFWVPLLMFALHAILGLIGSGLFLWMIGYLIVAGAQINSRCSAFIGGVTAMQNQPSNNGPSTLELA